MNGGRNSPVTNRLETAFWERKRERKNPFGSQDTLGYSSREFIYLFFKKSSMKEKSRISEKLPPTVLLTGNVNVYFHFGKVPTSLYTFTSWALEYFELGSMLRTLSPCHFTSQTNKQTNHINLKVTLWNLLPEACRMPFGCECLLTSSCWI